MAIFSIGMLAVGTMILTTTRTNADSNIMTQATMLARSKIEEKKREADAGALSGETESNIDNQGNAGGIYTRKCEVTQVSTTPLWEIRVTVSWTRNGRNRNVVFTTLHKGS
jgi:hypothetical protein